MQAMFQTGDQVMYGIHGLCKIIGLETQRVNKKNVEYYVLQPVAQPEARFYVPSKNEAAVAKLHPIMSREKLHNLLSCEDTKTGCWIDDENQRKQNYKILITSGDRAALIRMVHSIYQHKKVQEANGRKLHMCDSNFLKDAEKLLSTEFALVLGIPQEDVGDYIGNIFSEN